MIHVFVGPTLSRSEPLLSGPGLRVRPPAGHGDLFDPEIGEGDTVVLIDGVFHQAPRCATRRSWPRWTGARR